MAVVSEKEPRSVQFWSFRVDLRAGELRRNGSKIKLQGQPFQILTMLLARPGEVVTREELQRSSGLRIYSLISITVLNAAIRRLRDALDDSAENPRFVETVARRGYRFLAPVNGAAATVPAQPVPQPITSPKRLHIFGCAGSPAGRRCAGMGHCTLETPVCAGHLRTDQTGRLTASPEENPVLGAAISPDGKYLAFATGQVVYLRQIDSGETHSLSFPSGFTAIPAAWYPDGSHLVATWVEGPTAPFELMAGLDHGRHALAAD